MHNGSLWKIMETLVHHISSSRIPTVAILSHVVGLKTLYHSPFHFHPNSSSFAARWRQRFFFDPKYLINPWEFYKKIFTV